MVLKVAWHFIRFKFTLRYTCSVPLASQILWWRINHPTIFNLAIALFSKHLEYYLYAIFPVLAVYKTFEEPKRKLAPVLHTSPLALFENNNYSEQTLEELVMLPLFYSRFSANFNGATPGHHCTLCIKHNFRRMESVFFIVNWKLFKLRIMRIDTPDAMLARKDNFQFNLEFRNRFVHLFTALVL